MVVCIMGYTNVIIQRTGVHNNGMKRTYGQKQGFTLMEILIVIVLLGFLITAGVSSYTSSLKKSRDTKRKGDLRQIATSLEAYNNDVGGYPLGDAGTGRIVGCDGNPCEWGSAFQNASTMYMVLLPPDASSSQQYFYVSDGSYFQLYTRLENTKDSDIPDSSGDPGVYQNTDCSADSSSLYCNYGIASSNVAVDFEHTVIHE
jgi:general secretion pathway protein G